MGDNKIDSLYLYFSDGFALNWKSWDGMTVLFGCQIYYLLSTLFVNAWGVLDILIINNSIIADDRKKMQKSNKSYKTYRTCKLLP